MSIQYVCRYCHHSLGCIDQPEVTDAQLGFHLLTQEEKKGIIEYRNDGHIVAHVVCEHCQHTLDRFPELSLQSKIHQ